MESIYKLERIINGVPVTDYARFKYPNSCDLLLMLHSLGLEYCRGTKHGRDLYNQEGGLNLSQLMTCITPEMLAQCNITMTWLSEEAIDLNDAKVVGPYELNIYIKTRHDTEDDFRRLYNYARSIVRRLENHRSNRHPVLSTWSSEDVSTRALIWAKQFLTGTEKDFDKFFKQQVQKADAKMDSPKLPQPESMELVPVGT